MKTPIQNITIIGAGMWGTALANLASRNSHNICLWSRRNSESLATAIKKADLIISAVSIAGVSQTIKAIGQCNLNREIIFLSATKGLDPLTLLSPSVLWKNAFSDFPVAVLSGPNLSKEIQAELPAATVVASQDLVAAQRVQVALSSDKFRVYINDDPLGTELGGTLKNIIAIAAGVCDGLHLGTNAKAALLTRALPEIIRIGTYLGAKAETFFGLSGLGDLLATCNSSLSRNYQVGYRLAQGKSLGEILPQIEGTAEGVNSTEVLIKIAQQQNLYVPISYQVHHLLKGTISPQEAVKALLERDLKAEVL